MFPRDTEVEFEQLRTAFQQGRISRREFVQQSAGLGLSVVLMHSATVDPNAATNHLLNASPVALNQSSARQHPIEYLKASIGADFWQ